MEIACILCRKRLLPSEIKKKRAQWKQSSMLRCFWVLFFLCSFEGGGGNVLHKMWNSQWCDKTSLRWLWRRDGWLTCCLVRIAEEFWSRKLLWLLFRNTYLDLYIERKKNSDFFKTSCNIGYFRIILPATNTASHLHIASSAISMDWFKFENISHTYSAQCYVTCTCFRKDALKFSLICCLFESIFCISAI